MIWPILALMTVAVMAALLWPLLRPVRAAHDEDQTLAVYRDQLAEIERDRARGVLDAGEADAAHAEIARRMLAAARSESAQKQTKRDLFAPVMLAVGAPLMAGALYMVAGAPELALRGPQPPQDARSQLAAQMARMSPEERQQAIRGMVESLAARMEQQPDDLEGWRRLGRAWGVLGEHERSRAAYARALALAPDNAAVLADYARSFAPDLAEGRPLPPPFVEAMRRILALNPDDADAMWFVGLIELEAGNRARALELWERLHARLPADSEQARMVRERIERERAAR